MKVININYDFSNIEINIDGGRNVVSVNMGDHGFLPDVNPSTLSYLINSWYENDSTICIGNSLKYLTKVDLINTIDDYLNEENMNDYRKKFMMRVC